MTNYKIEDLAMVTATGNVLTESFGYDEFHARFIFGEELLAEYAWQPFENIPEDEYLHIILNEFGAIKDALWLVQDDCLRLYADVNDKV